MTHQQQKLTAVGFEPTRIAPPELESGALDRSAKLSVCHKGGAILLRVFRGPRCVMRKRAALSGNRTRAICLEGRYPNSPSLFVRRTPGGEKGGKGGKRKRLKRENRERGKKWKKEQRGGDVTAGSRGGKEEEGGPGRRCLPSQSTESANS